MDTANKNSSNYIFTEIIIAPRTEELETTLLALYEDDIKDYVQTIVATTGEAKEQTESLCKRVCKDIEVVCNDELSLAGVTDMALALAKGTYINYIQAGTYYTKDTFAYLRDYVVCKKQKLMYIPRVVYNRVDAFVRPSYDTKDVNVIDINSNPDNISLYFYSFFFKRSVFDKISLRPELMDQDRDFVLECLACYDAYAYTSRKMLIVPETLGNMTDLMLQYEKGWYLLEPEKYLIRHAKNAMGLAEDKKKAICLAVFLILYDRYCCNSNDRNKKILDDSEIEEFYGVSARILEYIPVETIVKKRKNHDINRYFKMLMLRQKLEHEGKEISFLENGDKLMLDATWSGGIKHLTDVTRLKNEKVSITAINYINHSLVIDFRPLIAECLSDDMYTISVVANGKELELEETYCYSLVKSFGHTIARGRGLQVTIPVGEQDINIRFLLGVNGNKYQQIISFSNSAARITRKLVKSYWEFTPGKLLVQNDNPRQLHIKNVKPVRILGREYKLLAEMRSYYREHTSDMECLKMLKLREKYMRTRRKYRGKRIWITFDKLYKGGDNGEYMYHYIRENCSDITPYYIINEDSPDYERLKQDGANILIADSDECRLMCLHAEVILATHATVWSYCGFSKSAQMYVRDLLNAKIVCIQHGLTVQKIAQYQNRLFDNTMFYCCASGVEKDNILQPVYGYDEKNIAMTGLARYDGLKNNDKKQILITPTWRRDIVKSGIAFVKKGYNEHFKESEYFRLYNSLINNKELIGKARETGYRLIFLLHPAMSSQSGDFEKNDAVDIIEAAGDMSYEKILTESSLMVTDYSGVQFDFAYMRKPVVYYHPDTLPPFYEEGVYEYASMGFGEICTKEEQLVDTLCGYMEGSCAMKPEYIARANDFFAFSDDKSCERIVAAVRKFLDEQ